MKPRILDLFCGAGGAARGYADVGFEVVGVDIKPQPNYPFEFAQADALEALRERACWANGTFYGLEDFDAIHASPPCQAFSNAQKIQGNDHPDLITPLRPLLKSTGLPYVIENVRGAPLKDVVELCGCMWPELRVYRPRWFETNWPLSGFFHDEDLKHRRPQAKMGRKPRPGEVIQPIGNFSDVKYARRAMGIDWMTRDELREAIPPAYTRYIGQELRDWLADGMDGLANPRPS